MEKRLILPFYAKIALLFICAFAFVFTMYIGQEIIIPIIYATIVAILLNPVVNFLSRKKIKRIIGITLIVAATIFVAFGIVYLISTQISMFSEAYPQLKQKFAVTNFQTVHWISATFKISEQQISRWLNETEIDVIRNFASSESLSQAGHMIMVGILLPVYLFMILYYKQLLLEFTKKLFIAQHQVAVADVLSNTKKIIQSYLVGLFFELLIIATLNSTGLLLLGIDYAIILGIIGAILNIIPYIGGIMAVSLPVLMAYITKDSLSYPLLVILLYAIIQFIDNHLIIPNIVASRVRLNALISLIAVLFGGAIWGIPGMFLSIPITAILKVVFDHIEPLKPWGYLLGSMTKPQHPGHQIIAS